MRTRLLVVLSVLLVSLLPTGAADAAKPVVAPPTISLIQDVDPELGTPILLIPYEWQGYTGRVTAHLTVRMNDVAVLTLVGNRYAGRAGDLTGFVPVTQGSQPNTFTATGYLTWGRSDEVVPGSAVSSEPTQLQLEAAPCG